MTGGPAREDALALRGIVKSYGSTRALRGVDLTLQPGAIQALIGPNGSGKSTLVKCLAGDLRPDRGEVLLGGVGRPGFASPTQARSAGVSVVHQDPECFEELSVADNIVIARPPRRGVGPWSVRDRAATVAVASRVLRRVGADIDPRERLRNLSLADRTLVAICRAIVEDVRFLVLDEPTAALGRDDAERVYRVCHAVREAGAGVLVVTHRLHEVVTHASRVTALRDGAIHADLSAESSSVEELVGLVADARSGRKEVVGVSPRDRAVVVSTHELDGDGYEGPVDVQLRAGEVTTVAGLPGSGANHFVRQLCGVAARARGEVRISHPDAQGAMGFVGESRRDEGVFPDMSVLDNMVIAAIDGPSWLPIRRRRLDARARQVAEQLGIVTASLDAPISSLSGGNQQKALIGRWVVADISVLGLEEPTNGLDVGAREDVYRAVGDLVGANKAVVARCTDEQEAAQLGDVILVFTEGRLVASLPGDATPGAVLEVSTPIVTHRRGMNES
ncbi:sugar ABC transporter ATP-binding protein [Nocardioides sp.]|uniref:ATP-binding cassette domain-containing protein n=1 Tax=Nocardioides sp. TaxID=35761 RepID=UPI00260301EF|nr:sugar ABC transporter ATP-binding protein [Nocardioides sp.]MDI6909367.1 sugar ABC transporter ATP-binding protein [Nocardioides sp.]